MNQTMPIVPAAAFRRPPLSQRRRLVRQRLELVLLASLLAHILALAILVVAHRLAGTPHEQEDAGVQMVWEQGPQSPSAPPPPPPASAAPEVNLAPDEFVPPPPAETPDYVPLPPPPPPRHRAAPSNPFANLPIYGAPSRTPSHTRSQFAMNRPLNLDVGPVVQGGQMREGIPQLNTFGATGEYGEILHQWILSHLYEYPDQALKNNESGLSSIKVTIAADGTVTGVKLTKSTGSRVLDLAWLNLFKGKRLPPFPYGMSAGSQSYDLSLDYEIIYR